MAERTTIHNGKDTSGELHVDFEHVHNAASIHCSAGGFNYCALLNAKESRAMAEALMKAAFKIEANTPQPAPMEVL